MPPIAADPFDRIRIAKPCNSNWDLMAGDGRKRHCSNCSKDVYNVQGLARAEALALITAGEGAVCMRLYRRPDGTILTADCGGARAAVGRSRLKVVAAAAAAVLSVVGLGAWATAADEPENCQLPGPGLEMVMGEVAMPDPSYGPASDAAARSETSSAR